MMVKSLQRTFQTEMHRIPKNVRNMTLNELALSYGGDIAAVGAEISRRRKQALEQWVDEVITPR